MSYLTSSRTTQDLRSQTIRKHWKNLKFGWRHSPAPTPRRDQTPTTTIKKHAKIDINPCPTPKPTGHPIPPQIPRTPPHNPSNLITISLQHLHPSVAKTIIRDPFDQKEEFKTENMVSLQSPRRFICYLMRAKLYPADSLADSLQNITLLSKCQ